MDLNELYRKLIQTKAEIDPLLHAIESSNDAPSIAVQQRLSFLVDQFKKDVGFLKTESEKVTDTKSRGMWITRSSRLQEDLNVLRIACDRRLGLLFKNQREQEDRDLLFGSGSSNMKENSNLASERMSLNSSHNMLDNITEQSRAILDNIIGQNATLKNARGKMFDLINSAGAGSVLSNAINTREKADALILYGCMGITVLIFLLLWFFVKGC